MFWVVWYGSLCSIQPNRFEMIFLTSFIFVLELCGAFMVAFGEFQVMQSRFASLIPSFWPIYPANTIVATGTIVTCVCYLGVLGGMRENRCMLNTVSKNSEDNQITLKTLF